MQPPLHPLMQTYPGGRLIDSSAPLPLIPFSSLLPFHDDNTPPKKKSTPCYVHLPFIFSPYNAFTYFFVLNQPWMSSYVHLHIWPQASSKLYTNYKHRNNFHISFFVTSASPLLAEVQNKRQEPALQLHFLILHSELSPFIVRYFPPYVIIHSFEWLLSNVL